ncbi:WXG100 family type VII secretion target [Gordonia sp. SID5947]|uniref:WXG100 family type VII secretion target n=1 Tax=Gordonia sp. SID5947 TaxID=2690315 RepID=UPI0013685DA8|nr:WXG100 family type VII secretion target [Gordonia sp. SID5947]MYR07564.1 WXG100 family type VII secretion target [Gordonia sp. SID5947]
MAEGNNFELDLDAGFKHTDTVHEVIDSLRQTLKVISGEVDTARASWVGDAFNAFQSTATEWDSEAARLNAKLNDLAETLSGTVFKGSDTANQDIASSFSSMQAGGLNL